MATPIFRDGIMFTNIDDVRKALNAYNIRQKMKIKNDRTRLHVVCGFVIRAYKGEHMCEGVYEMRALTAKFLRNKFIEELRYNKKMTSKHLLQRYIENLTCIVIGGSCVEQGS
jgi:hypothetical protein